MSSTIKKKNSNALVYPKSCYSIIDQFDYFERLYSFYIKIIVIQKLIPQNDETQMPFVVFHL